MLDENVSEKTTPVAYVDTKCLLKMEVSALTSALAGSRCTAAELRANSWPCKRPLCSLTRSRSADSDRAECHTAAIASMLQPSLRNGEQTPTWCLSKAPVQTHTQSTITTYSWRREMRSIRLALLIACAHVRAHTHIKWSREQLFDRASLSVLCLHLSLLE